VASGLSTRFSALDVQRAFPADYAFGA